MARPDAGYSDISRGMTRIPEALDELQMRAFWRAWQAQMNEEPDPADRQRCPETVDTPVAVVSRVKAAS